MMTEQKPFTVAIMQPYFLPYAGYFRLFAASDLFVIYDCVQFPRRGWVHRNRLVDARGVERWVTLPLAKAPRHVLIRDLRFSHDALELLAARLRPFRLEAEDYEVQKILATMREVRGSPVDYLERLLKSVVMYLGLSWSVMRSSALEVPTAIRGQQRILEISRRVGAARYVNAPGGTKLYDHNAFADAGMELCFLDRYPGPSSSILTRLIEESRDSLVEDVHKTTRYMPVEMSPAEPCG
jgi:hypothetical protein